MADNHNNNKKNEGIFDDAESDMDTNSTGSNDHENSNKNGNGSDDDEDLFAPSSSEPSPSSSKKKTTSNNKNNATDRLAGLSKFVRRILDPNREPRGLIEPPQVIPLNDEFLQAFGKREQEFDRQLGRDANFDQTIPDDDDDEGEGEDAKRNKKRKRSQENEEDEEGDTNKPTKVKVSNLLYTTTEETLAEECRNFGPVLEVNMIMDDNNPEKNVGRAYVVFADERSAQACVDQQLGGDLNGRPIRVALAENLPKKSASNPTAGGARYYQKDISTKCFRCGKIGHIGANCPNPPKANICPLCAKVDEHDMRACPWNRVCFNCGIPGHVSRECRLPRGQPPRQICTLCCGSGHDRFSCRRSATSVPGIQAAICCVCHQRGHFMCQDMKWFFGLEGVFCFNCGAKGHVGHQCNRPNLDDLARNDGWALKELERAEEYKLADEMEDQRMERERQERERQLEKEQKRQRNKERFREQDRRSRAKSAPPPRSRGYASGGGGGKVFRFTVDDGASGYQNSSNNRRGGRGGGGNNRGRRGY